MRKPDKPALLRSALTDMTSEKLPSHCTYVIDGGCLLHKVHWGHEKTISELVQQHVDYVTRKSGYWVVVVFDGYNDALSTKDHEYRRRQQRIHKVAPVVDVATSQVLGFDQDTFLANEQNKDSFIFLLLAAFSTVGIKSSQAPGDADTVIVSEALLHASTTDSRSIIVFADDTDILAMLLYHATRDMPAIYFLSEGKKTTQDKCIHIQSLQAKLGPSMCQKILVLHAFGGSDTTSAIW